MQELTILYKKNNKSFEITIENAKNMTFEEMKNELKNMSYTEKKIFLENLHYSDNRFAKSIFINLDKGGKSIGKNICENILAHLYSFANYVINADYYNKINYNYHDNFNIV
jgi:hypothetical protein